MGAMVCWKDLAFRDGIYVVPSSGSNDSITVQPIRIDIHT